MKVESMMEEPELSGQNIESEDFSQSQGDLSLKKQHESTLIETSPIKLDFSPSTVFKHSPTMIKINRD